MFIVDLECENGHAFEGWYDSRAEYDSICAAGDLTCPLCESGRVRNKMSTGAPVTSKRADRQERERHRVYLHEYTGRRFTERAIAMHKGEEPEEPIWGVVSPEDQKRLDEEGVPTGPVDEVALAIPLPKPDPTEVN